MFSIYVRADGRQRHLEYKFEDPDNIHDRRKVHFLIFFLFLQIFNIFSRIKRRHTTSKMSVSSAELNPRPIRVSPLIKFSRWTFLTLGIIYGAYYQNKFSKIENARREKEERERPAREAKLALEKKRALEEEQKMLDDLITGKL